MRLYTFFFNCHILIQRTCFTIDYIFCICEVSNKRLDRKKVVCLLTTYIFIHSNIAFLVKIFGVGMEVPLFFLNNAGVLRDKTMDDKLTYNIHPSDNTNCPYCRLKLLVKTFIDYKFANNQAKLKKSYFRCND